MYSNAAKINAKRTRKYWYTYMMCVHDIIKWNRGSQMKAHEEQGKAAQLPTKQKGAWWWVCIVEYQRPQSKLFNRNFSSSRPAFVTSAEAKPAGRALPRKTPTLRGDSRKIIRALPLCRKRQPASTASAGREACVNTSREESECTDTLVIIYYALASAGCVYICIYCDAGKFATWSARFAFFWADFLYLRDCWIFELRRDEMPLFAPALNEPP